MTPHGGGSDALFRGPLPAGFSRRVVEVAPGLECRAGTCGRFAPGSMLSIARLPVAHLRSVGPGPLVLVAVSRAAGEGTDEFQRDLGSYGRD